MYHDTEVSFRDEIVFEMFRITAQKWEQGSSEVGSKHDKAESPLEKIKKCFSKGMN